MKIKELVRASNSWLSLPPAPPPPSIPHLLAPALFIPFLLLRGAVSPPAQGLTSHSACISSLCSLLTDLLQPIHRSLRAPISQGRFPSILLVSPACGPKHLLHFSDAVTYTCVSLPTLMLSRISMNLFPDHQ